jgi:hypothetical protein
VRIWIDEDRYAPARRRCERERVSIVGQDCDGAVRHGISGECPAVLASPGQSSEEKAAANGSRVSAEAHDLRIGAGAGGEAR